jgi:hypothetical protein
MDSNPVTFQVLDRCLTQSSLDIEDALLRVQILVVQTEVSQDPAVPLQGDVVGFHLQFLVVVDLLTDLGRRSSLIVLRANFLRNECQTE